LPSVRVVSAPAGRCGRPHVDGRLAVLPPCGALWVGWVKLASFALLCLRVASFWVVSPRVASPCVVSCCRASPRVVSRRVASCRVVSRRVALACVALSRLALSRLALACCASCRLPCGASRGASLPCPGVCFGGRVCRPMYGWTGFRLCGREVVGWLSGFTSGRRALWGCFVVTDRMYPSCGT
jgi:hypothetical protein